jgi:cyclophilin family peptidyl-prolyl cis-trans isomerase
MARTSDPDSARVQFFINHKDNDSLNYPNKHDPSGFGYTVFGKVIQGMDTVDNIAKVPTGNFGNYQNVPNTPIIIKEVKVISEK